MPYSTEKQLENLRKQTTCSEHQSGEQQDGLTMEQRRINRLSQSMSEMEFPDFVKPALEREKSNFSIASAASLSSMMSSAEIAEYGKRGIHRVKSNSSLYEDIIDEEDKSSRRKEILQKIGKMTGGIVIIAFAPILVICGACGGCAIASTKTPVKMQASNSDMTSQTVAVCSSMDSSIPSTIQTRLNF